MPLCAWCQINRVKSRRKQFCSTTCAAFYRNSLPHIQEQKRQYGKAILAEAGRRANDQEKNRQASSERMKLNNPMSNPETVQKMAHSLQGRTFLARGGNGKLTEPQKKLCQALSLPEEFMEWVVLTLPVQGQFPSLPNHYKVDIAIPHLKLAIEVDGSSHKTRKWQFLDKRKTLVLEALGWKVLRFTNEQVMQELASVTRQVTGYMT
jgi:hypothetical protein